MTFDDMPGGPRWVTRLSFRNRPHSGRHVWTACVRPGTPGATTRHAPPAGCGRRPSRYRISLSTALNPSMESERRLARRVNKPVNAARSRRPAQAIRQRAEFRQLVLLQLARLVTADEHLEH